MPLSLFLQAERHTRIERSIIINDCMRGTICEFAEWLSALGAWGTRLAGDLAAETTPATAPSASSISSTIVRSLTSASRGVRSNTPCATGCPTRSNIRESGNDIRRLQCDGR
jgi:hypothetical protein